MICGSKDEIRSVMTVRKHPAYALLRWTGQQLTFGLSDFRTPTSNIQRFNFHPYDSFFTPHPHFKNSGIALPQVYTSWCPSFNSR
jgi:hypothetical protein